MQVKDSTANLVKVIVTTQAERLESNISLFVHTRQANNYSESKPLIAGKAVFVFEKNRMGDGISQITVFNMLGKPVSERLYFKRHAKDFVLDGKVNYTGSQIHNTNGKVLLESLIHLLLKL